MKRSVSGQVMGASVVALLVLSALPSVAGAANTDPTVYETHDYGPNHISQAVSPQPYLTLQVPAGGWVAWVRLQTYTTGNIRRIKCTLSAKNGALGLLPPAAAQSGFVTTVGKDEFDTIALTASIGSRGLPVTFSIRCRDESATAPTGAVDALQTRITAMRLSSLTQTSLQTTGSSRNVRPGTSAGGVRGSSPAELIQGYRTSDLAIPISSLPKTITTLPLPQGLWSVRTSFSIVSISGNESGDPINRGHCRILLSANRGRSSTTADRVFVNVGDPGHPEDREAYYLDTSGPLTASGALRLQCWQTEGQGDLVVRGLRVSALKSGTLKIGSAASGSASVSYGRGLPIVRYMRTQESQQTSSDVGTDVGQIKLPAGTWWVYAKLNFEATAIVCHLYVPELGEDQMDMLGGQLVLGRVTEPDGSTTVSLSCRSFRNDQPPIEVGYVHLTAIKVKAP